MRALHRDVERAPARLREAAASVTPPCPSCGKDGANHRFVHGDTPERDHSVWECGSCRFAWTEPLDSHLRYSGGGSILLDIVPVKRD